ncbi:MAG: hypothetical protein GTO12_06510 [Proteobacteria bacterium]|nr:hypothetical protein [Pseudomonadota bacterium]
MEIICYQCNDEIGYTVPFSDHRATYALCYACLRRLLEAGHVHQRNDEKRKMDHYVRK